MFELTSVNVGIALNLLAERMAKLPRGIALLRSGSLAGLLWHDTVSPSCINGRKGSLMVQFTGGCLCGTIRYEVNAEPQRIQNCHCDDCRKVTGSAFASNIFVAEDDVVITQGEPKSFSHAADSGNTMTKEFCANCGSQLFGLGSGRPGIKNIKVGSIDDASFVQPMRNVFVKRALPFTQIDRSLDCFDGMPE